MKKYIEEVRHWITLGCSIWTLSLFFNGCHLWIICQLCSNQGKYMTCSICLSRFYINMSYILCFQVEPTNYQRPPPRTVWKHEPPVSNHWSLFCEIFITKGSFIWGWCILNARKSIAYHFIMSYKPSEVMCGFFLQHIWTLE